MNCHKRGEALKNRIRMLEPMPDSFTTKEFAAKWDCSYIQARDHLRYMEGDNLVKKGGTYRARIYTKVRTVTWN